MTSAPDLPLTHLVLAAGLLALPLGASAWLRLGLARPLLVAAVRMAAQLFAIGLVLDALLRVQVPLWIAALLAVMLAFAGREVRARQERPLAGAWGYGVATLSMAAGLTVALGVALATAVRPDPWFDAGVLIPLGGMILGNAMTGVALAVSALVRGVESEGRAVEAQLALGEPIDVALRPLVRRALAQGLMPTINAMAATGLVFLPGMMTGQILAGVAPLVAVKMQLLVMLLISGGTGLGALLAVRLTAHRLSDERHRLRIDRLVPRRR